MSKPQIKWKWSLLPRRCVFAGPVENIPELYIVRNVQGYHITWCMELRWLKWHIWIHRCITMNTHLPRDRAHDMNNQYSILRGWT